MVTSVIEVQGLSKSYRSRRGGPRIALDGVDISIDRPGVFGLLGPNGSGKTTAIRCLLGLVRPTGGTVQLFGTDIADLHTVAHRVGALVEGPKFTPSMSGRTNLDLLAAMGGVPRARVHEVLELVELGDRADDPVGSFSLGMAQRLGIAAALLRDPQLVILDEPTNGLDPAGIADVRRLVRRLADEGRTVLLSSHMLHEVQHVCDEAIVLRKGAVIANGTVADIIASHTVGRLIVNVDERDLALAIVWRAGLTAVPGLDARQLVVNLATGVGPADVNRMLAHEGLFASEIRADHVTLEDAFLHLTAEQSTESSHVSESSPLESA